MDRLFNAFLSSAFGSDELQSYSAEYTWLANQMAHAMMGFFLASLLSWLLRSRNGDKSPHIAVGLLPFLIPLLKVLPDALVVAKQSTLPVSWAEFFADKATDLSFWYIGMFAGLLLFFPKARSRRRALVGGAILVAWLALSAWLILEWTAQKQTFDSSDLPPGWIRASQYNTDRLGSDETREAEVTKVTEYLDYVRSGNGNRVRHLIIRGGRAEDRSDLAVALGTEWAARVKTVRYVTAARLLDDPKDITAWAETGDAGGLHAVIVDDLIDQVPGQPNPGRSPSFRESMKPLANKRVTVSPFKEVPTGLSAGEVRLLATLWNVRAALQASGFRASTVWAVGGSPARVKDLVADLTAILAGDDQEVVEVFLGPPPESGTEPVTPTPPQKGSPKRAATKR